MMTALDDISRKVLAFPAAAVASAAMPAAAATPPVPAAPVGPLSGFIREHPLPFAVGCMALSLGAAFAMLEGGWRVLPQLHPASAAGSPAPRAAAMPAAVAPPAAPPTPQAAVPARTAVAPAPASAPAQRRTEELARQGDLKNEAPPTGIRISVRRRQQEPPAPALALKGWEALRTGDLDASRDAYSQALQEDARDTDALRGLAAIAQRQGQPAEARRLYRQILEIAPKDALADAALGLQEDVGGNSMEEESRLKTLAASDTAVPAVHFALGNLYARQQRWRDAEQAYFEAVAGDPGNPDYHYNLAVCLDQLTQPQLAAQYYKSALARAAAHAPAFDVALTRSRLAELEAH